MTELRLRIPDSVYRNEAASLRIPISVAEIDKAVKYVNSGQFIHPIVITNNVFTLPEKFCKVTKRPKHVNVTSISGPPYFFIGKLNNNIYSKLAFTLTVNENVSRIAEFKPGDVIDLHVNNSNVQSRLYAQTKSGSLYFHIPKRIAGKIGINAAGYYQMSIERSRATRPSNDHFYKPSAERPASLYRHSQSGVLDLKQFLEHSFAQTRSGTKRAFNTETNRSKIVVHYESSNPSGRVCLKQRLPLDEKFYRVFGLIQAEGSKSVKKPFCFTNTNPELVGYIVRWFENVLGFDRKLWTYELCIGDKSQEAKEKFRWSKILKVPKSCIACYKRFNKSPCMNLRCARTLSQIILRLLDAVRNDAHKNRFSAGNFISGVLAGDGCSHIQKSNLHLVSISFDPKKIQHGENDEPLLYFKCLDRMGIRKADMSVWIIRHRKSSWFIRKFPLKNVRIKLRKSHALGFGGEICIHKYRSFVRLNAFRPFYPDNQRWKKFESGLARIDSARCHK